jgi:hypothetical protein
VAQGDELYRSLIKEGRREMSNAVAIRALAQDMASAQQEERTKRIAEIKKENKEQAAETYKILQGFSKEDRKRAADARQRAAQTSSLLAGFDKKQKEMGSLLKAELSKAMAELAKAEAEREKQAEAEAKERAAEAKARTTEVARIRSEARELIERFRQDSVEAAAAWRELVATMQAKRGLAIAPSPVTPSPIAEVEEEVPAEEVIPEEKMRLEEEILSLISQHPEGIKLTEIAERIGTARIKAGNIARMLVDEGKIRKQGLLYFPYFPL